MTPVIECRRRRKHALDIVYSSVLKLRLHGYCAVDYNVRHEALAVAEQEHRNKNFQTVVARSDDLFINGSRIRRKDSYPLAVDRLLRDSKSQNQKWEKERGRG